MTTRLRACARLLGLLLCLHTCTTAAGVVQTLDGKTIRGAIRLEVGDGLVLTLRNKEPIRVPFTNLLRANFIATEETNPPPSNAHLPPANLDEHRGALPSPWKTADVGNPKRPGVAAHYHGSFTLEAHPAVKRIKGDTLYFVYRPWQGDGEFIARVASVEPRQAKEKLARAGLMLRASLEADSPSVSMSLTGGAGSVFRRKSRKGERVINDPRPDLNPPYWVKLVREGGAIAGFQSTDGHQWKLVGSSETDLPEKILLGLGVTGSRKAKCLATLDHITLRPLQPRAAFIPRIVLRDGTVVADHFSAISETEVLLSKEKQARKLRTADVARLLFQPGFEVDTLTPGRAGVLMSNGDFIDGDFRGIEANWVKISSVLLGQRRYELNRKVAAVLLRDVTPQPAPLEVATLDGSLWRPGRLTCKRDTLILATPLVGEWRIASDELLEIRRTTPR